MNHKMKFRRLRFSHCCFNGSNGVRFSCSQTVGFHFFQLIGFEVRQTGCMPIVMMRSILGKKMRGDSYEPPPHHFFMVSAGQPTHESAITELRNESGEVVDNIHSWEHCCAKYDFGYNSQRCKTN